MPEERKLVTILFADVTGSTALGESLDPEDVRALMSLYYEHAREIISSHGGTIEKFIGDAVMAVFGLIQAHGDDAERALAAAMVIPAREAQTRSSSTATSATRSGIPRPPELAPISSRLTRAYSTVLPASCRMRLSRATTPLVRPVLTRWR